MKKFLGLSLLLVLAFCGCGAGPMAGPAPVTAPTPAPTPPPPPPATPNDIHAVNHIILFMQENRSYDHYFAKLNEYRAAHGQGAADVDIMDIAKVSLPTWDGSPNVSPFHMNSMFSLNLSSAWQETHVDIYKNSASNPRTPPPMDGFVYTAGG